MSQFSSWERRDVYVSDVALDKLNPRIPGGGPNVTERELIAQLIEHEDVYSLAKTIATQGFYPSEFLICVDENNETVVVEGNRRLACLKLLATPELAPDQSQTNKFKKLAKAAGAGLITELEVLIAPMRSSTVPLVMAKHTREGVRSWEPLQQANYVKSLLDAGMKLDDLPALTGIQRGEIVKNLKTHSLYEMATRLPLDRKTKDAVSDPRQFPASTLERVSGSPDLRDLLGIGFDAAGGVVGTIDPEEFQRIYTRIIKDIVSDTINTRVLNDSKGIKRYINTVRSVAPDRSKTGSFTSDSFLNAQQISATHATPAAPPPKRTRATKPTTLIPRSFKCYLDMPRIKDVLIELQQLKVEQYENAVSVLLRIFVELSISHYLESTARMETLIARIDKRGQKRKDWTPSLRQMLNEVLTNDATVKIPRQALKALSKAVADDNYPLSLDGMDQFVHNPYVAPSERQLRQFWNTFEKLVEHFMKVQPVVS